MTRAEVKAPTRIAICCNRGVAPTRKPVLRSCEVVPPLEAAMQTTAATDSAVSVAGLARPAQRPERSGRSAAAWRRSCRRSDSTTSRSRRSVATRP